MLAGVNDSHAQAVATGRQILDPSIFKVNLIPFNPTGSEFQGSSPKAIEAFKDELERHGLIATVRLTRGRDIDAACGQLAAARARSQRILPLKACPRAGSRDPRVASVSDRAAQPRAQIAPPT